MPCDNTIYSNHFVCNAHFSFDRCRIIETHANATPRRIRPLDEFISCIELAKTFSPCHALHVRSNIFYGSYWFRVRCCLLFSCEFFLSFSFRSGSGILPSFWDMWRLQHQNEPESFDVWQNSWCWTNEYELKVLGSPKIDKALVNINLHAACWI